MWQNAEAENLPTFCKEVNYETEAKGNPLIVFDSTLTAYTC